jgi:hypothetical protein
MLLFMRLPVVMKNAGIIFPRLLSLLLLGLLVLTLLVLLVFRVHTWNTPFHQYIPQTRAQVARGAKASALSLAPNRLR